jgi:hypothetical protein
MVKSSGVMQEAKQKDGQELGNNVKGYAQRVLRTKDQQRKRTCTKGVMSWRTTKDEVEELRNS